MRRWIPFAIFGLLFLLPTAALAQRDPPPPIAVTYTSPDGRLSLRIPDEWAVREDGLDRWVIDTNPATGGNIARPDEPIALLLFQYPTRTRTTQGAMSVFFRQTGLDYAGANVAEFGGQRITLAYNQDDNDIAFTAVTVPSPGSALFMTFLALPGDRTHYEQRMLEILASATSPQAYIEAPELTETFNADGDGLTFKYPAGWSAEGGGRFGWAYYNDFGTGSDVQEAGVNVEVAIELIDFDDVNINYDELEPEDIEDALIDRFSFSANQLTRPTVYGTAALRYEQSPFYVQYLVPFNSESFVYAEIFLDSADIERVRQTQPLAQSILDTIRFRR